MAAGEIHVGDSGLDLQLTVRDQDGLPVPLTGQTLSLLFQKPDGNQLSVVPTILNGSGIDGIMHYITGSGDLNIAGIWKMQGKVAGFNSDIPSFKVFSNEP